MSVLVSRSNPIPTEPAMGDPLTTGEIAFGLVGVVILLVLGGLTLHALLEA